MKGFHILFIRLGLKCLPMYHDVSKNLYTK